VRTGALLAPVDHGLEVPDRVVVVPLGGLPSVERDLEALGVQLGRDQRGVGGVVGVGRRILDGELDRLPVLHPLAAYLGVPVAGQQLGHLGAVTGGGQVVAVRRVE